ncbi:MAG: hypothetical protein ACTHW2_07445 [Tissierella sp.]|uniref:hypothetical protein n=1 Tax=Tissierella sp. TaxID=41274 RepID=UPI003F9A6A75
MVNSNNISKSLKVYFSIILVVLSTWYLTTYLDIAWLGTAINLVYYASSIVGLFLLFKILQGDYNLLQFTKYVYFFNIAYFSINYLLDYILLNEDNKSLIYVIFLIAVFWYILKKEKKVR